MSRAATSKAVSFFVMVGIYKITSPSGKIYIGQSVIIEQRFKQYKLLSNSKSQIKLHRSFMKHGIENHAFSILEECKEHDLNSRERYYQELYSATGIYGLNLLLTSCHGMTGRHSDETKQKMKLGSIGKNKGIIRSLETNKKNSDSKKGIKASAETKLKMSLARKGVPILKGKNRKKRTPVSEETKIKISNSVKNKQSRGKHSLAKKVIDTNNGVIYNCAMDAAEACGVKYNSLNKYLNGKNKNKTTLIYLSNTNFLY